MGFPRNITNWKSSADMRLHILVCARRMRWKFAWRISLPRLLVVFIARQFPLLFLVDALISVTLKCFYGSLGISIIMMNCDWVGGRYTLRGEKKSSIGAVICFVFTSWLRKTDKAPIAVQRVSLTFKNHRQTLTRRQNEFAVLEASKIRFWLIKTSLASDQLPYEW